MERLQVQIVYNDVKTKTKGFAWCKAQALESGMLHWLRKGPAS